LSLVFAFPVIRNAERRLEQSKRRVFGNVGRIDGEKWMMDVGVSRKIRGRRVRRAR